MLRVLEFKISLQFLDKVLKLLKTLGIIVLVIFLLSLFVQDEFRFRYRFWEHFWAGVIGFVIYTIFIRIFRLIIGFGLTLIQIAENSFDKNNKSALIALVKQDGRALQFASEEMKDNKEIVLIAVKKDGYALQFASERLKDDDEVVSEAIVIFYSALQFASLRLQNQLKR
jgi:hypothetical protein